MLLFDIAGWKRFEEYIMIDFEREVWSNWCLVVVDCMHSFDRGLRERNYVYYVMCINSIIFINY